MPDARLRVTALLEVTEEATQYVTNMTYAEVLAGVCSESHAAARVAHIQGILEGVRSALFALDGAEPETALSHLIVENWLRGKTEGKS